MEQDLDELENIVTSFQERTLAKLKELEEKHAKERSFLIWIKRYPTITRIARKLFERLRDAFRGDIWDDDDRGNKINMFGNKNDGKLLTPGLQTVDSFELTVTDKDHRYYKYLYMDKGQQKGNSVY